jgi:hypothetical protein
LNKARRLGRRASERPGVGSTVELGRARLVETSGGDLEELSFTMVENRKMTPKIRLKLAYSFGTYAVLIWIGYLFSGNTNEFAYTFLVGLGGAAVGNVLGLLASPYNRGEKTSFPDYAKALATFVTGFLLSKLDKLLSVAADPQILAGHPIYRASTCLSGCRGDGCDHHLHIPRILPRR